MDLEALRFHYLRRIVAPAFGALGLDVSTHVARAFARGIFGLNTSGRIRAEQRACDALGLSLGDPKALTMVEGMYDHLGRFWSEVLFLKRLLRESSWRRFIEVDDEISLRDLANRRSGCLVCTSHFGNPAVGAFALGQIFRPIHVLVDVAQHAALRTWQRELFACPGVRVIDRREGAAIPSLLEAGHSVLIIAESERPRGRAEAVDFLGRRLRCYPTIDRLAGWLNVPVVAMTCRRLEKTFSFQFEASVVRKCDDGSLVRGALGRLERAILRAPEQYLWSVETLTDRRAVTPAPVPATERFLGSSRLVQA